MSNKEKFTIQDFLLKLEQIDYSTIMIILSPVISYYVTQKAIDGYNLHRDYKPKNISRINLPPELTQKHSNIDIEKIAYQQFSEAIIRFAKLIIDKIPSRDLINFYNNLNELKINPKKFRFENLVLRTTTIGKYNVKKNQIEVDVAHSSAIYHELFHMASSIYKDEVRYSGFRQSSSKFGVVSFGKGLNEGYTQLLTERYFGDIKKIKGAYVYEVHIADKLEKLVGQEKMESLYLNANLPGLLTELKKYASEEEIAKFISGIDFLCEHLKDKNLLPFEKSMITNSLKNVNKFLLSAYAIKLKTQLDDGILNINEFHKQITTYISSLGTGITIDKRSYEFLSIENLQENLKTILDTPNLTVDIKTDETESKRK